MEKERSSMEKQNKARSLGLDFFYRWVLFTQGVFGGILTGKTNEA